MLWLHFKIMFTHLKEQNRLLVVILHNMEQFTWGMEHMVQLLNKCADLMQLLTYLMHLPKRITFG